MHVNIPTALRKHTDGNSQVDVDGETLGQAIQRLVQTHPDLRSSLLDDSGELVNFVGVFVGGQNIRDLDGQQTPVSDRDEILLVPAIAGG